MRKLLFISLLFLCPNLFATDYFLAANGNDANNGTTISTPWQTLDKLNATTLVAGDNVYFRRGDTFYGKVYLDMYGSVSDSLVFTSYGTGANPVITGFTSVSSWTNLGSNIWESTSTVSTLSKLNLVVINGVNTPMGRFPNADNTYPFLPNFFTFQSHSGTTSITSSSLSGYNFAGADVVVRQNQWTLNKSVISSQSGTTLTLTGLYEEPNNGWGLYIQNSASILDQQNEWYYNPTTKKIRIYSTSQPVNVKIASIDTLLANKNHGWPQNSYVSIRDIDFVGANIKGISLNGIGNSNISGCHISYTGEHGMYLTGLSNFKVENNLITDCGTSAIEHGNGSSITIAYNTVKRAGLVSAILYNDYDGVAITFVAANSLAHHNRIDSSAHGGISFRGSNSIVRNNFITNSNFHRGDNGGIYTAHAGETGKVITENIVLNSIGNGRGTSDGGLEGYGIYLDDLAEYVTVTNNTAANCGGAGFFFHNANNNQVHDNTFYNNGSSTTWSNGQMFNQSDGNEFAGLSRANNITRNIFFAKEANQSSLKWYVADSSNYITKQGIIDSNYYAKPINPSNAMLDWQVSGAITYTDLAGWQSRTGIDLNSQTAPKTINSTDSLRFEYNATDNPVVVSLDAKYIDVKNTLYNGTITLQPWSSAVLLYDSPLGANTPPTVNVGPPQTIDLNAVDSLILTATVTPGTTPIVSKLWTKVSGPSGGSIASPTTDVTTVTALEVGTYVFRLTATDQNDLNGFGEVTIQVHRYTAPTQLLRIKGNVLLKQL